MVRYAEHFNIDTSIENRVIDLVSEVGELSKEVLKSTNYGKSDFAITDAFKEELGDVYFSLLLLAEKTNVDLEELLESVLLKYRNRLVKRNNIGSKN